MKYRALDESLVRVAETVRKYFVAAEGASKFRAEAEIAPDLAYRPTLLGQVGKAGLLAIEVNGGMYSDTLDRFVLECRDQGLPIRLFVASPALTAEGLKIDLVRRAKRRSVGVVEVEGSTVSVLLSALSLSLSGVRPIEKARFPKVYRGDLQTAEDTFRNGDAAKGCARVYDLIERRSRAVAQEIKNKNLWRPPRPGEAPPKLSARMAWSRLLEVVDDHADFAKMKANGLAIDKALWARLRALTTHRNQSGHEPESREELVRRDRELRTRFEHAVDTFADLIAASAKVAS